MPVIALSELERWAGKETGVSSWMIIDQERIDRFADVTEDWQFIHTDPEKAVTTPFGGTIAHGFLTLSMLSRFALGAALGIEGTAMGINYGFDRIRMLAPVRCGARIRGRFVLNRFELKSPERVLLGYDATIDIEGEDRPAVSAEWLAMHLLVAPATHLPSSRPPSMRND